MKKLLLLVLLLTGGIAQAQEPIKPTPTVATGIMTWEMQNDACEKGDLQACRFRDAELLEIESQGWCLTDSKKWQPSPCKSEPAAVPLSDKIFELEKDKFPAALQRDWSDFAARFEHAFPVLTTEDGWVVGYGCMANKSNTDAAGWALSTDSGAFGAIIKRDEKFFIYGSTEVIPTPLAVWGVANGMTDSNMVRQ
jgi:hypothetical protein